MMMTRRPPAAVVGYDVTFSVPKSVSLLWAANGLQTGLSADIFSDIDWTIETEPEVDEWFDTLTREEFGYVAFHVDRLATVGSMLTGPHNQL